MKTRHLKPVGMLRANNRLRSYSGRIVRADVPDASGKDWLRRNFSGRARCMGPDVGSYRDGKQTSRVYYDTITFNTPVPVRLFEKPSNPKEVK